MIVYYSRNHHTEQVVKEVKAELERDIAGIPPVDTY